MRQRGGALRLLGVRVEDPVAERDATPRSTLIDRRGEGVHIILESSERLSGKIPVYRLLHEAELVLVTPAAALQHAAQGGGEAGAGATW